MLTIVVPARAEIKAFDEEKNQFLNIPAAESVILHLEHSLASMSKWESHWRKPFLSSTARTLEETLWYVRSMTLNDVHPEVYARLTEQNLSDIQEYVTAEVTATWFAEDNAAAKSKEIVTAEIVYYWMFSLQIPMECQHWHLNRLLTQIRVINEKNAPKDKKKSVSQAALARRRELNAQRRAQLGTSG